MSGNPYLCLPRLLALLGVGLFAGATTVGCQSPPSHEPEPRLYRAHAGRIEDGRGRVIALRGMNFANAAKSAPDHLVDVLPEDIHNFISGGINVARLLTFWKAITPDAPGTVDASYLRAYVERVERFTNAGIYVVVDMHQDLWGVPFAPHGAPAWACPEEISAGYVRQSPWWVNYGSAQVSGCFDNFWRRPELQDALAQAWAAVAEAVCHEERVLGFDLLNEPHAGTAMFDADFDNTVLMAFYQRLIDAIEPVCPGRLFFVEPTSGFVLGLTNPIVVPDHLKDRVVWAGHYYPPEVHEPTGGGYDGDFAALELELGGMVDVQRQNGIPVWIGEYGGMTESTNFTQYIRDLHTILGGRGVGTALWDYARNDGSFAFLDASGSRKAVFDPVFGTPLLSELPADAAVTSDFDRHQSSATFGCRAGTPIRVLLPEASCACDATPLGALDTVPGGPGFQTATCQTDDSLTLTCSCAAP